jgi:hypothetical protein
MEKLEITEEVLERLAASMAQAIPDLECPERCDCGWVYRYVELSAKFYREEWEWACLAYAIVRYRVARKSEKYGPD